MGIIVLNFEKLSYQIKLEFGTKVTFALAECSTNSLKVGDIQIIGFHWLLARGHCNAYFNNGNK